MSFSPRVWCQRKMAGVQKWSLTDKLVVVESSETHLRSLLLIPPSFHRGFAGCCLIPFFMDQLRDVHHQCPNCKEHIHTFQPLWLGCVICTAWSVTSLLEWQLPEVSELFGTRPWHSSFFFCRTTLRELNKHFDILPLLWARACFIFDSTVDLGNAPGTDWLKSRQYWSQTFYVRPLLQLASEYLVEQLFLWLWCIKGALCGFGEDILIWRERSSLTSSLN